MLVGIDVGVSGCIVALERGGAYIAHEQLRARSDGRLDAAAVAAFLRYLAICDSDSVTIEKVGARPLQGLCSAFSFGHSAGAIEGALAALSVSFAYVTPQDWKKQAGLIGLDKDASRIKALESYPQIKDLQKKGKGQALADAIYIALAEVK